MSSTYNLYCLDCGDVAWIGQRGAGSTKPWIYKLPEDLDRLEKFLQEHEGCFICFADDFCTTADERITQLNRRYYAKEED